MHLLEAGVWKERRTTRDFTGAAALFLDRDGVINVDHGYVGHPNDVDLIEVTAQLIAHANAAGHPVVVVTNQSGIGRGYYDWDGFAVTMDDIHDKLQQVGAQIDMVCACAYHDAAQEPYRKPKHEMRKPRAGMINLACQELNLVAEGSFIVGDSVSDMEAGVAGGLAGGIYLGQAEWTAPPSFALARYCLPQDGDAFLRSGQAFWADKKGAE